MILRFADDGAEVEDVPGGRLRVTSWPPVGPAPPADAGIVAWVAIEHGGVELAVGLTMSEAGRLASAVRVLTHGTRGAP